MENQESCDLRDISEPYRKRIWPMIAMSSFSIYRRRGTSLKSYESTSEIEWLPLHLVFIMDVCQESFTCIWKRSHLYWVSYNSVVPCMNLITHSKSKRQKSNSGWESNLTHQPRCHCAWPSDDRQPIASKCHAIRHGVSVNKSLCFIYSK